MEWQREGETQKKRFFRAVPEALKKIVIAQLCLSDTELVFQVLPKGLLKKRYLVNFRPQVVYLFSLFSLYGNYSTQTILIVSLFTP